MFWDIFYKCCIDQNTKPNPIGCKLGFSSGVITKWKNGGIPSGEALIKIANYFNVSVDYLLGRTNYPSITIDPDIILYNKLDTEDKAEIRGTMKQMLKAEKYSTVSNENIKLVADSTESTHINARKKKPRMTE